MKRAALLRAMPLIAALAAAQASAQTPLPVLGRLFTTPAERIELDHQRYNAPMPVPDAATPAAAATTAATAGTAPAAEPPPPAPPPAPVQLSGVVRRSDGSATIWLDNEPRETRLRGYTPGASVPVEINGRRVLMKPGQHYQPDNGTLTDSR